MSYRNGMKSKEKRMTVAASVHTTEAKVMTRDLKGGTAKLSRNIKRR
jgi:hypothetical protein